MRLIPALTIALGLTAAPALARDVTEIRHQGMMIVCANAKAMPVSGRGDPEGYQMEIARELARDIGVRMVVEWVWADYQLRRTECDMVLGAPRDPKPGGYLRFVQALSDVEIELVFAGEPRDVAPEDLAGQVVALPSASLAHFKLIDVGADPRVAYKSEAAILAAIAEGTLDAGVVSSVARDWYQHLHPEARFHAVSTDILGIPSRYPVSIALRKTDSLGEDDFRDLIEAMRQDGRLEAIMARYGLTLSTQFDNRYAKVPDAVSEPEGSTVRRDIVEELERLAAENREKLKARKGDD